uniref:Synembryn n=1 Tax=Gadus morhua TaxID=8049 RepID=A0A8C5AGK5_GADMO
MTMDLNSIIDQLETGDQDVALVALQIYNKENSQCFAFNKDGESERERLGKLVLGFLTRELQPSCQLACVETVRILSRDKHCLGPFVSHSAMATLATIAGIGTAETGQVRFFDLRLTFLLTALRVDVRAQLAKELHGISLLGNQLDATLGLCWPDTFESARAGSEGIPPEELPPLSREQTERAMEILKTLFNITFNTAKSEVDEEDAAEYRHLGAILRHCLMSCADGEERTEEFHSHTVNLLGNLPLPSLDVLLMPKVQQGSIEHMGVNMDAVHMLLDFMEKRLDRGNKLKETLLPCLNLLTESARIHRETRKFLRSKVLPPLRDVKNRPEVGSSLRNKLVRLMTHIDTDVKTCVAELIFVLCKESVSRFIKYTGYGNAAGLLAARGLLRGAGDSGIYSGDEDSETEEYREAKALINPVTGVVEEEQSNPMEGMTEEQKEYEAMKLVSMFDKLSRNNIIQPMQLGGDGRITELNQDDMQRLVHNPHVQPRSTHLGRT